jgi:hypothetical protein
VLLVGVYLGAKQDDQQCHQRTHVKTQAVAGPVRPDKRRSQARRGLIWIKLSTSSRQSNRCTIELRAGNGLDTCGALAAAMMVDAAVTGCCEIAESQTPVLGATVPYAIGNVVLTGLGPIIVACTFVG